MRSNNETPEDGMKNMTNASTPLGKIPSMSTPGEKIILPNETKARDHDLWLQCPKCYTIVLIYEAKKESKLKDFIETSDNPFTQGKEIVGIDNKKQLTPIQKERKKTNSKNYEKK